MWFGALLGWIASLSLATGQYCTQQEGTSMVGKDIAVQVIPVRDCCVRCASQVPGCEAAIYVNGSCHFKASRSERTQADPYSTLLIVGFGLSPGPPPAPIPGPSPVPSPEPMPEPPRAFPTGDGKITPNFFPNDPFWRSTDGRRIQAHSGHMKQDKKTKKWLWIGNSDEDGSPGGGQNTQISLYTSDELYGPWGPEEVLMTVSQARTLLNMEDLSVLERPKIHQDLDGGWYYLFLHLDNSNYMMRKLGVFKMAELQPPSASNPWMVVFSGRPGSNPNRGDKGFEVLDFNIYNDPVTNQLLYSATTDSYVFLAPDYCDTDVSVETTAGIKVGDAQMCANTAIVTFVVSGLGDADTASLVFNPLATLPGRWEGMTMFRKPGDNTTLYMLCSGQDGFGPNPQNLFSADWTSEGPVLSTDGPPPSQYHWPAPTIWTCLGNPFSGSATALNSQPLHVLPNPYSPTTNGIYIGDNWLHGPGKDYSSPGPCSDPNSKPYSTECEPWQGDCPCDWPESKCPMTSNPGPNAGYVWVSFPWDKVGVTDYLFCAQPAWDMTAPPKEIDTCYTFNLFPDPTRTLGFVNVRDYEGKPAPYIVSSCGFAMCPGWPLSASNNLDTECCKKMGDSITQAKYQGRCYRDTVCGGTCKDNEFGNIPGGDGGCKYNPFDPSKAKVIAGSGDCARARAGSNVVDQCRGVHNIPPSDLLTSVLV